MTIVSIGVKDSAKVHSILFCFWQGATPLLSIVPAMAALPGLLTAGRRHVPLTWCAAAVMCIRLSEHRHMLTTCDSMVHQQMCMAKRLRLP